jgi:hypothetical protein
MLERANTLIVGRREHLTRVLGRPLPAPTARPPAATEQVRRHLLEEAEELYWNEMAWEHITGEEGLGDGALLEMAFPGFLAFVRALLLREVLPDAMGGPAQPRPEVVEDLLLFLGERVVALEEELAGEADERDRLVGELTMTSRLLNGVLYNLHGLSPAEVERVEAAQVRH